MRIKKALDGLVLKIPIISPIIKKINIARAVRALAMSSEIVPKTLTNCYYQEAVVRALEKMKRGERLSQALKNYPDLFPLMVIQMIEVGEETGGMANILKKLGDFFKEEAAHDIKKLTAIIELALMIIMGGIAGFFIVSLLQRR